MPTSATGRPERGRTAERRSRHAHAGGRNAVQHGLALIEVLVVVAIAGVLLGAVTLAFPDSAARRLDNAAQRAQALIQLACERAELSGRDIGIGVAQRRLGFGPLREGRWQPIVQRSDEPLRARELDPLVELSLRRDGAPLPLTEELPERPQLACLATGELVPFEMELTLAAGARARIVGSAAGMVTRERDDAQ